ncbi:MAG TPA: tyrosine-type recombinase/integrase [Flavobacteriales bacterium]|nr:tyrosine-type recombinase/integrase [Flavobacteriales bacterium]
MAFIEHLKFQKRASAHTVAAYEGDLKDFFNYTNQHYDINQPQEISTVIIRSWIANLVEQGLEPRSVARKVSTLRSYYKYLLRHNQITTNPLTRVVVPKIKKRLPVFVDQGRMDNLFMHMPEAHAYTEFLEQAIMELFYATGMRLTELVELKLHNYDGHSVKVLGKRSKERIIPLTETAVEALTVYLAQRRELEKVVDNQYLFLLDSGKKLYKKFVYRIVNTYLARVTTEKKKSPHVLRHTFATHLLNNGAQLNAIKELLGHASLAATQVYTHNTISKLINIHQNAHPLEKRRAR